MKIKNLIIILIFSILFVSCMFTEEIYVNNDGSGNYSFKMDMGEMMKSMSEMSPKDSLKKPTVLDSIVLFKDILEKNKDSISKLPKDEQLTINALKDLKLHMRVDEEKGEMLLDFMLDFEDLSELKNMQKKITKAQALSDPNKKDKSTPSKADVDYLFDGKTFNRKVVLKELSEEKLVEFNESIKQASSFLEGSLYRVIYHFENRIKSVSYKDAQISKDGKTVIIEVPMDSLAKNPQLLNFEVKLK